MQKIQDGRIFCFLNTSFLTVDDEWECVSGRTEELGEIYNTIYKDGPLKYEIEMFDDDGNCRIMFYRLSTRNF